MEGRAGQSSGRPPAGAPLVGRQDVLRVLERALEAADKGDFRFVTLVGEPGAGKTRLLSELATAADARKLTWLSGRAAEFEQEMPFGAVVDAMDDLLEEERPNLNPATLDALGTIFPSLADVTSPLPGAAGTPPDPGSRVARYQLHRTVRHLLEQLAAAHGLVLILDDLHWADDATIELLDHVVRHPPRARVLIVSAYRPAQASPRLAALVNTAAQGVYVPVEPLTRAEVGEFLGPQVGRPRAEALFKASGGNPFYLEALARMDRGHEQGRNEDDAEQQSWEMGVAELTDVPSTVRTALQVELSALPPDALLLARAAAVAADEFEPALAAVAAEMDQPTALAALDMLTGRDVVRATATGRFRFRHPLVRHVAYASTAAGWRLAAHDRVAAHLAALGAPAPVRAHHVVRSARFGDRSAITTLTEAARSVSAQAPATAAHWLGAALRLMPDEPDPARDPAQQDADETGPGRPDRLELLLELAHVQTVSGQAVEATETARTLLDLLPPDDISRRAAAVHLCARMERQLGRVHEARALVLDELHRITDRQTPEAVLLRIRLVADRIQRIDVRGAQAVLDTLPDSAPEWGPGLKAAVASMRPLPAYGAGRISDAIRHLEAAAQMFSAASDTDFTACLDYVQWLVWSETLLGRYDDALRHSERLMTIARATGQSYIMGYLLAAQARVHTLQGRLKEAAALADEAAALGRLLRSPEVTAYGLTYQCLALSRMGEHEAALRLGKEAVSHDTGADDWWARMTHCALAVAVINSGRLDEGAAALIEACGDGTQGLDFGSLVAFAEMLAWVSAERDRPDEARKWADIAEALAFQDFNGEVGVARLAVSHAIRAAEPAQAAVLADEAVELLEKAGRRPEAGRAAFAAGIAFRDAGDRAQARERLSAAAKIFDSCDMAALLAKTVREQRKLGVRVPGTSRGGGAGGKEELPFGLSPREHEIATLVAEGCSNQQIAERLFLSVRTVETHLSRVFAKVGVSSRVGVATTMNRQG
ncbi:AAA family ATPase [Spirillospora sp. NPDC047279]|uniref:helix-turn-helix transcriptional regulator n=1 Tax=Spirillospora sp. NPDC047279 TaxID=3155478 RepID=UPI0033E5BB29